MSSLMLDEEPEQDVHVAPATSAQARNDDDEDDPALSLNRIKREAGFAPDGTNMGGATTSSGLDEEEGGGAPEYEDGGNVPARVVGELSSRLNMLETDIAALRAVRRESFQPGATAYDEEKRRIMCWNVVGSVTCRVDEDDNSQSIEIEYADSARRRPNAKLPSDANTYDKASLSRLGVLLSTVNGHADPTSVRMRMRNMDGGHDDDDDDDEPDMSNNNDGEGSHHHARNAIIKFRPLDSSLNSVELKAAEWTFALPKRESVACIACAEEFSAVATSRGFLRVFRPSGLQEPVLLVPGVVHTMCARESLLLVVYYQDALTRVEGGKVEQHLAFQLYDMGKERTARQRRNGGVRILASGSLRCFEGVSWCGFGDETMGFMPLVLRRDGMLLGLSVHQHWNWVAVADLVGLDRGSKLWPISVSREHGILAVALRNGRREPSVQPRSMSTLFKLRMPLLGLASLSKGKNKYDEEAAALLAEEVLAQRVHARYEDEDELNKAEVAADVALLRNIFVAIKQNDTKRAFGFAMRLRLSKSLEVAQKKADEERNERLYQLLDDLAQERRAAEGEEEEDHDAAQRQVEEERQLPRYVPSERPPVLRAPQKVANNRTSGGSVRVGFTRDDDDEGGRDNDDDSREEDEGEGEGTDKNNTTPKKKKVRMSFAEHEEDDHAEEVITASSPVGGGGVQDVPARKKKPMNPFLKSSSPATRKSHPAPFRNSPIRQPELSRSATFTTEARDEYRRKI